MGRVSLLITLGLALVISAVVAEQQDSAKTSSKQVDVADGDYDDYDYDYDLEKGSHKLKKKHKLFLFIRGIHSLAAFVAIKIKIILIVIAVIGIIGFTLKVFGALKLAGYFDKDCPIIHEPVYGYSAPPRPPEHIEYEHDWSPTERFARGLMENYIDTDFVYRIWKKIDMAEMVFSALNVNTDQCRRHLICEIDAKSRKIPFFNYTVQFFSQGFEKYRTKGSLPKYKECAKLFSECSQYERATERRRRKRRAFGKVTRRP